MKRLFTPDINGVFHSPLGDVDLTQMKWGSMKEYLHEKLVQQFPESILLEPQTGHQVTYKALYELGEKAASFFLQEGYPERTIVHIVGENTLKWLVVYVACHINNYIVTSSHPVSPWPELARNIRNTCATVLVLTETCYNKFKNDIDSPFLDSVIVSRDETKEGDYSVSLERHGRVATEEHSYDKGELADVASLIMSSGTSGAPKAVKMSGEAMIYMVLQATAPGLMVMDQGSVTFLVQPLAHIGGQVVTFLTSIHQGPKIIVTDYPGSLGLLELAQKYRMTHIVAVPSVLNFLAQYEDLEKYDLSSLRYILTGATNVNFDSIDTIIKRTGNSRILPKNLYGATEMNGLITCTHDEIKTNIESIGVPYPGVKVKVMDIETESKPITEPNVEGHLLVKHDLKFQLYFKDPEKTKESLTEDGWFRTGDLVYFDENFNLYVSGRIKDIVKFRGFTVSPAELEDVLLQHQSVLDCAVVAEPSEAHFEIPSAFCVLKETNTASDALAEDIIQFVGKQVSEHKKIHKVYFVESIPRNGSGKILKRVLKQRFSK